MLFVLMPAVCAITMTSGYPKLANLYFNWSIGADDANALARYDILIIDMEAQVYSPQNLQLLKKLNPDIKLVAYLAAEEIRGDSGSLSGTMRQRLFNKIQGGWWLRDFAGKKIEWWPGNPMINITDQTVLNNGQNWGDVLSQFVKNDLLATGYWDGVFFDNSWENLDFMKSDNIDLNNDGRSESMDFINAKWQLGMEDLLWKTRNLLGSEYLILGNGGDSYHDYLNGVLYEHFTGRDWASLMQKYKQIALSGFYPAIGILNSTTAALNRSDDYKTMRYGLASALLGDGYSSFDNGAASHSEIWWYDEYETSLGKPAGEAFNVFDSGKAFKPGVWRRDFTNGLVLVNSSNESRDVDLGADYEKIQGTQDAGINDGSIASEVSLASKDGIILLRTLDKIAGAVYMNGSFARVFNRFGHVARSGFFSYNDKFRGGSQVIERDINNDDAIEFISAEGNRVDVYDSIGNKIQTFFPYTEKFKNKINIAVGDLDNDGQLEIVTGAADGGPQIMIFNNQGRQIGKSFFAFDKNSRGGASVALGDVDGDGLLEIIAGAGVRNAPETRVFNRDKKLISKFLAYDKNFRGGVNLAAGDINADGIDEIITGAGKGGGPHVRVFDKNGKSAGPSFFAFDKSLRSGVKVTAADLDNDGLFEIIATTSDVFTLAGL
ncbi:MAG: putative glycoside hydrolase [Parcubacteria group bacterium]